MIKTSQKHPYPTNQIVIDHWEKPQDPSLYIQTWVTVLGLSTAPSLCLETEKDHSKLLEEIRSKTHSTDVSKRLDGIQELGKVMTVSYLSQNAEHWFY